MINTGRAVKTFFAPGFAITTYLNERQVQTTNKAAKIAYFILKFVTALFELVKHVVFAPIYVAQLTLHKPAPVLLDQQPPAPTRNLEVESLSVAPIAAPSTAVVIKDSETLGTIPPVADTDQSELQPQKISEPMTKPAVRVLSNETMLAFLKDPTAVEQFIEENPDNGPQLVQLARIVLGEFSEQIDERTIGLLENPKAFDQLINEDLVNIP